MAILYWIRSFWNSGWGTGLTSKPGRGFLPQASERPSWVSLDGHSPETLWGTMTEAASLR